MKPWTKAEERRLVEAYAAGQLAQDLAVVFGRSYGAIRERLRRLGVARVPRWTVEMDEDLVRLRAEGKTWAEVGQHFGIGAQAARERGIRIRKRMG